MGTKVIDLSKPQGSYSARSYNNAAQKPHQKRQQIIERQETYDSTENRFLVHVLRDILLLKAKPLAEYAKNQAYKLEKIQRQPENRHGRTYYNLWKERRVEINAVAQRWKESAKRIEKNVEAVQDRLNEPFLREACASATSLVRPSAKIANSKEYGPIYRAYQDYLNNKRTIGRKNLVWALEEKNVRRSSNLYEMWAFLEIYAKLIREFGFESIGESPLDLAEVIDGEITLQSGKQYKLSFSPKNLPGNDPLCTIAFSYNPKINVPLCNEKKRCFVSEICASLPCYNRWSFLTPDITMFIQSGNLIPTNKSLRIALDIKYRNYLNQKFGFKNERSEFGVDSVFELDLLITAKMKYLNSLDFDAAYFIHSDKATQYTTFGSEPFVSNPIRERRMEYRYYPAHRVGAICLTPEQDDSIEKLIRCILMYHVKLDNVCWNCHRVLTEENGGVKRHSDNENSKFYQCVECGQFWVTQECGGEHRHPIIRMGRDSFHKISARDEWNCTCPACGDAFNERFPLHSKS